MNTRQKEEKRKWLKELLSVREVDVLNVLWRTGKAMTGAEIADHIQGMVQNVALTTLRRLLEKGLVEVAGSIRIRSVFSRTFRPTQASRDLMLNSFIEDYACFKAVVAPSDICGVILMAEEDPSKLKREIEKLKIIMAKRS